MLFTVNNEVPDGFEPIILRVNHFNPHTAKKFAEGVSRARENKQPFLPIVIDSYGGEVYALMSMIDTLDMCTMPIVTVVQGKAMSCGAVLFTFGSKGMRFIGPNATLMLHDVAITGYKDEKTHEATATAQEIDRINKILWQRMEKNIGKPKNFLWKKAHENGRADLYIDADTAGQWGIASKKGIPRWDIQISMNHHLLFPE